MSTSTIITWVIIIGLMGYLIHIFNKLVSLRNQFKNSFAQIDVQLKRRYDLIPNLVETAKGYLKHEQETLTAVTQARNQAQRAEQQASKAPETSAMDSLLAAEKSLGSAMSRFMMVVEQYPDLKADQTMINLMEELSTTENRVAFSRQAYNDSVMMYNTAREVFPNNLIANMLNFRSATLFEITHEVEREDVKVQF